MKSIYTYSDYRVYLRELLLDNKIRGVKLTYEELGKRVGFKSKGFVTQILQGKTKIPESKIKKFASALGLANRKMKYFELLVRYNQAKTNKTKNVYFNKLTSDFKTRVQHLGPDKYEYYTAWYYSAVRSLLAYYPFDGDFKKLAMQLEPSITPGQARKAIGLLEKLELIEKQEDGLYRLTHRLISADGAVPPFAILNYQKSTMDLAKLSLDKHPKPLRSSATLTLGLSSKGYAEVKKKLEELRREIVKIAGYDKRIDRVIQLNLHAFPLTKPGKGST